MRSSRVLVALTQGTRRDEFNEALQFAGLFTTSQQLSAIFKYFDRSGDGYVDFDEFIAALRVCSPNLMM